jgi:hypothetical protein
VIERNLFFRLYSAVTGELISAAQKKIFVNFKQPENIAQDRDGLNRFYYGYLYYRFIDSLRRPYASTKRNREIFGKVFAMSLNAPSYFDDEPVEPTAAEYATFEERWRLCLASIAASKGERFISYFKDRDTGEQRKAFSIDQWLRHRSAADDIRSFFAPVTVEIP